MTNSGFWWIWPFCSFLNTRWAWANHESSMWRLLTVHIVPHLQTNASSQHGECYSNHNPTNSLQEANFRSKETASTRHTRRYRATFYRIPHERSKYWPCTVKLQNTTVNDPLCGSLPVRFLCWKPIMPHRLCIRTSKPKSPQKLLTTETHETSILDMFYDFLCYSLQNGESNNVTNSKSNHWSLIASQPYLISFLLISPLCTREKWDNPKLQTPALALDLQHDKSKKDKKIKVKLARTYEFARYNYPAAPTKRAIAF